jgi:protein TonB
MTIPSTPPAPRGGIVSSGWLAADSSFTHKDDRKVGRAFALSMALHGAGLVVLLIVMSLAPERVFEPTVPEKYDLVFVHTAGPGGGGGGGGNTMPDPPQKLEMKAEAPKPVVVEPVPVEVPPPALIAPIQTTTPLLQNTGAMVGLAAAPAFGTGSGGGGDTGTGTGAGPGNGPGVGPGTGGGIGDGPMGPGSGAAPPELLRGVDPKYTTEAMRAKIQGVVVLEALISPSGAVQSVRVIKSLDTVHGLDTEAELTAKKWLFRPARFQGKPVAYLVEIQMAFNLR